MRTRTRFLLAILLLTTLSCQAATRLMQPPAPTPTSPPTATLTPTPIPASPTPLPPTATPLPPSPTASPTPTLSPTPRPTTSPQHLQVFGELWQVVKDNYLYQDFNGLDWDAVNEEYRQRIEAGLTQEEFYLAMDEIIERLGDEHSIFFSPQEASIEDSGFAGEYDYVGIGTLSSAVPERQRLTIILVFPGSPAEEAGLQIHDSILAVDGQPIIDESGLRAHSLRGPEGTQVTLTVLTPGQDPRQVILTRRKITSPLPVPHSLLASPAGKRVGYILLPTFNDINVGEQVGNALHELGKDGPLDALIIDNRQNAGGASNVLRDTLSYFTSGTVGHFVNRDGDSSLRVRGENVNGSQNVPLVVLVGPGTASFGEIFSGIMQDIGRAYLIGEQTDGNVEILYIYEFSDGSRVWLAHDTFRPLNNPGQDWEETGILPDLTVASNWDEITMETDPAVRAALEYFDNR